MRKIFLFLITFFIIIQTSFATLSISPLKFEFDMNSNSTKKEVIKITNSSDKSITLYTETEDFIAWDDTWTPKFVKTKDQINPEYSLSSWVKVDDSNITLAPNESKEISFTIKAPKDAEPGWHYAAVFFSPWAPSWVQVAVVQRLWVLVLVNVSWDAKIEWNLKSIKVWNTTSDNKFKENNLFSNFPITFETVFQNTWNIHIKPNWKITLIDENWEILKNVWKETITSPAWAYIWEKMVDYIPINDTLWNVLPKSERKFTSNWLWFWYSVLNEDWTKTVNFKNLTDYYADKASEKAQFLMPWQSINSRNVKKEITAKIELSYEWKNKEKKDFLDEKKITIEYQEKYVWLNYIVIWIIIIFLIVVVLYFMIIWPKQKAKKEEELRKKIIEEMNSNKN